MLRKLRRIYDRVISAIAHRQIERAYYAARRVAYAEAAMMVDLEENIPGASFQEGAKKQCFAELYRHFQICAQRAYENELKHAQ